MRVLILAFGTRGDVQPYVALARGLLAGGHQAAVCTAEGFRDLVTGAGVPYEGACGPFNRSTLAGQRS